MNLRAEKSLLKKELDKIEDEQLIKTIKELLKYANQSNEKRILKPFTEKQLIKRAKTSEKNIKSGSYTSVESLRKQVSNW